MSTVSTSPKSRTARFASLAGVVVAAALLLSACATKPGVAVQVGDYSFSRSDLDEVTQAQCVLAGAQPAQSQGSASRATTAQSTLAVIVQARQAIAYARTHDVSPDASQLRQARAGFADQLDGKGLSGAQRDSLLDVSELVTRGQLIQAAVGAKRLGVPAAGAAAQQAVSAGQQTIAAWAAKSGPDVTFDPRYNLGVEKGQLQLRDGSVSVPVSTVGKQSAAQQQSGSYVSSLPAPQQCG